MQRASPRQPDLVVVDLPLNLLSGEATLQALRMEFGHALPVIALVPRKHQALARNLRAATILEVPFEVADLVTAAHSAVQA